MLEIKYIYSFFQADRIKTKTGKKKPTKQNQHHFTSLPLSLLALSMNKRLNIKGTGKATTGLCPGKTDRKQISQLTLMGCCCYFVYLQQGLKLQNLLVNYKHLKSS